MIRTQSRARREAAFIEAARKMHYQLEDWYDTHPNASFGEIEAEARKRCQRQLESNLATIRNAHLDGTPDGVGFRSVCAGEAIVMQGFVVGCAEQLPGHGGW